MVSTTDNSDFKSNCVGRGSYSFIKTVGLSGVELSNNTLLAITKSLLLKFK